MRYLLIKESIILIVQSSIEITYTTVGTAVINYNELRIVFSEYEQIYNSSVNLTKAYYKIKNKI